MGTIVIKLKKTNYLAIVLIITFALWQGYGLYQGKIMGANINQYIYTKVISNVIPGTIAQEKNKETNMLNKLFHLLTGIDTTNYKSLIEKNIPLMRYEILLGSNEDSKGLIGFKKAKTKDKSEIDEDYFDQSEELIITYFENTLVTDRVVTREQIESNNYVVQKLINFDANLNFENQAIKEIDTVKLIEKEFKLNPKTGGPKVLIFHTHATERFAGEEPGSGGIIDVGSYLKQILETQYGLSTLHCTSSFEPVANDGKTDAYGRMEPEIKKILKDNPTIELVIDLHRDGVYGDQKFITNVNGKTTAKLMFVNGFSKVQKQGVLTPIESLPNPYLEDNIGLSLQMQLKGNEIYPGLMRKTLIKPYRYSLHMKPMSLLIETGNQNNTKEEALNAMEPLAEILMDVIEKD